MFHRFMGCIDATFNNTRYDSLDGDSTAEDYCSALQPIPTCFDNTTECETGIDFVRTMIISFKEVRFFQC